MELIQRMTTLCTLVVLFSPAAIGTPSTRAKSDDVPDGLQTLLKGFEDILQEAISKKEDAKLSAQLENMRLPEPEKWFVEVFGQENGSKLAAVYVEKAKPDEAQIIDYFLLHGQPGGQVVASVASGGTTPQKTDFLQRVDDAIRKAAKAPIVVYRMQYSWAGADGKPGPKYFLGFLVGAGGMYRRIPDGVLSQLPEMPALRVRQGAAVAEAALEDNNVSPVYPKEARKKGISGTVRLHAIIGQDGRVQDLTVVSGDPLLVDAALVAVRHWRYRPMLVEGKPVEVDTVIDVVFSLRH